MSFVQVTNKIDSKTKDMNMIGTNFDDIIKGLTDGTRDLNVASLIGKVTVTTIPNLTGMVTSVGNATTVVTNANLTGGVTSVGNVTTVITNANLTGPITSSGNATTIASLLTYGVSVVQLSNLGIATSDTDTLVFDFVPAKIIIDYSGKGYDSVNAKHGETKGHSVITITGTNTFTSNLNATGFTEYATSFDAPYVINDTTNVIYVYTGYGTSQGYFVATATWTTATKTLTLTYTQTTTTPGANFLELVATAYK